MARLRNQCAVPIAMFLVAVIGGACHLVHAAALEPGYESKPLSWWLSWWSTNREGGWTSADGLPFRVADLSQGRPALSEMGPAAVPFIIERVRREDNLRLDRLQAAAYFGYLGSNAIPQLVSAMKDPNPAVRQAATHALVPHAGNALSVSETARIFGKALGDGDDEVIATSLEALDRIGSSASNCVPELIRVLHISLTDSNKSDAWKWETTALGTHILASVGSPAASAVPILTNLLHAPPPVDELGAAVAVWRITGDTSTALPVLLKWSGYGWLKAIETLGEMGPAANGAVPLLLSMAKGRDSLRQRIASAALKRIDPDAEGKGGVK
jgi:HEAT repeat protein